MSWISRSTLARPAQSEPRRRSPATLLRRTRLEFLTTIAPTSSRRSRRRTPHELVHLVSEWAVILAVIAVAIGLAWLAITSLLVGVSVPFV